MQQSGVCRHQWLPVYAKQMTRSLENHATAYSATELFQADLLPCQHLQEGRTLWLVAWSQQ
jgi:hypothetical protein